jgi:type I restriction enzyme R subunit
MPSDPSAESEWQTRKERIDNRLTKWGWTLARFDPARPLSDYRRHAVFEYPTDHGPADYALFVDGVILGILEAKKLSLGPQNVLSQAERYSRGALGNPLDYRGFRVPFLFSTNGEVIWFHDVRHPLNLSRRIADYPTPEALAEWLGRDFEGACDRVKLLTASLDGLRPYQRDAVADIENAIGARRRQMLVAMATGTGKTKAAVGLAYRLMKAGVARRILFLVDRRALAAQAVGAFGSFEPEPGLKFNKIYEVYSQRFRREEMEGDGSFDPTLLPEKYLTDPQPGLAFVYVCTIQRMAGYLFGDRGTFEPGDEAPEEDTKQLPIPIHAFDFLIADECHRGYTAQEVSTWRDTLSHFDAIKVGLTATPAAHTTSYFDFVAARYEYDRAVREGYLVDYNAVAIRSGVRINGVFLREGEQVGMVDTVSGSEQLDLLEDERQFDSTDVERQITVPDSNRKIVEELRKYADEHEQRYGRFPKTLIFAANDLPHVSHADRLVEICREVFGRGDSFVQKITGSPTVDRPLQRIREFRNRTNPGIVVSVDLMSTGVDIPDLEFIVFLRPVRSRILWDQMLGRGTRKGEKFTDKSHFTVFDCFDGSLLAYFRNVSQMTAELPDKPTRPLREVIEDIWQNRDRPYNVRCLVRRLQRIDKEMSGDARDQFAAFIPDGDLRRFAADLPDRLSANFAETTTLLRAPAFQDLLVNYPRPRKVFLVAHAAQDQVSSEWLIRDGTGREHRPADYLTIFSQYVRDNPDRIEAIRILLDRPQGWSSDALDELRKKLAATSGRFSADALEKAHALCYGKALVDIISMVKHAASDEEPLLTAQERVERALARLTDGQEIGEDQRKWLDRIRSHLVENLSIETGDFDDLPIFAREGGWGRANRAFGGNLAEWLARINEAIAA